MYITACANVATLPPISDVADVDMDDPVERSGGGGGGLLYGGGGRCGGDADDDEAGWASEREDGVLDGGFGGWGGLWKEEDVEECPAMPGMGRTVRPPAAAVAEVGLRIGDPVASREDCLFTFKETEW